MPNLIDSLPSVKLERNRTMSGAAIAITLCGLGGDVGIRFCPVCHKAHIRQKFCSLKCTTAASSGGSVKPCVTCGKPTFKPRACSRECLKAYRRKIDKDDYQRDRERRLARQREYDKTYRHTEAYRQKEKRKTAKRWVKIKNDPALRMARAIRNAVNMAIKRRTAIKHGRTFDLLGCSGKQLAEHLERQFRRGMTWDNYGKVWHIDHITPLSYFDMSCPQDQRRAWNWQNLRPLWADQNIREGNKRGVSQTVLPLCL